jgi:pimeloyl-ACP methyl ester carboxylesterase
MTTQYAALASTGRVQSGESGVLIPPRVINGSGRYPLIACHGAGASWDSWLAPGWPRATEMLQKAAVAGIPGIAEHLGGDTYGNPTSSARLAAALTAVAAATGCSSSKAHFVTISMGCAVAMEYAIANPTKVASLTCMIPLASIINTQNSNPPTGTEANAAGSLAGSIATAWGTAYRTVTDAVTNSTTTLTSATAAFVAGDVGKTLVSKAANGIPAGTTIISRESATSVTMSAPASTSGSGRIVGIAAPLPAGANLLSLAPGLAGIPTRLYYAPDDTLIVPADVAALATAIGPSAVAQATNGGGHTDAGMLPTAFDIDAWVEWLIANGG